MPLLLSGCGLPISMPGFTDSSVQLAVVYESDRYVAGEVVQVSGTVGDRVPLVDAQVYQLQDDTGSIWVLTTDTSIQSGDRLTVEGQVEVERIEVGAVTARERYLREVEQLDHQPATPESGD